MTRAFGMTAEAVFLVPGSLFPVLCSLFRIPAESERLPDRLEAAQSAPVRAKDLDRHVVTLDEAARDEPARERRVLAPQSEDVANRQPKPPVLPIETSFVECAQVLLGGGRDQVVQRLQGVGERCRPTLTCHPRALNVAAPPDESRAASPPRTCCRIASASARARRARSSTRRSSGCIGVAATRSATTSRSAGPSIFAMASTSSKYNAAFMTRS